MATVVPCASCYARSSVQPLQLFGWGPRRGHNQPRFTRRGTCYTPRPSLAGDESALTLRQICRLLKVMKQVRNRENATTARKQGSSTPGSPPGTKWEKKCVPSCLRYKRSIKRIS